jgi:hypothetical protein
MGCLVPISGTSQQPVSRYPMPHRVEARQDQNGRELDVGSVLRIPGLGGGATNPHPSLIQLCSLRIFLYRSSSGVRQAIPSVLRVREVGGMGVRRERDNKARYTCRWRGGFDKAARRIIRLYLGRPVAIVGIIASPASALPRPRSCHHSAPAPAHLPCWNQLLAQSRKSFRKPQTTGTS